MPFQYILADLIASSENAVGAIFLDDTGEAVDLASVGLSPFDLRIVGANLGLYLRSAGRSLQDSPLGSPRLIHIEGERLQIHVVTLPDGYYLALVLDGAGLVGPARRNLLEASEKLARTVLAD